MSQQGLTYADFVKSELNWEYQREISVNSRAGTAMTSAVGLATLATAMASLLKGKSVPIRGLSAVGLYAGVIALIAAALFAVRSYSSKGKYAITSVEQLKDFCKERWGDSEITARSIVAQLQIETIQSLRIRTNRKSLWLLVSHACQILAIALLSFSAILGYLAK